MSFCYIHAIAPLCDGKRVQVQRPNNNSPVWHAVYDTMLVTEEGGDLQGTFRTFSPASGSIAPSETLILINGKFSMSPQLSSTVPLEFLIEPLNHVPFNVDPMEEESDSFLPSSTVPTLLFLGTVFGAIVHMSDGAKAVDVRVSNYMQSKTVDSIYRCRFPATPRWSRINMPIAGSVIMISGRPHSMSGVDGSGLLVVTVEDIVYNPGSTLMSEDLRTFTPNSNKRLQVKKRKYGAMNTTDNQTKEPDVEHNSAPSSKDEISLNDCSDAEIVQPKKRRLTSKKQSDSKDVSTKKPTAEASTDNTKSAAKTKNAAKTKDADAKTKDAAAKTKDATAKTKDAAAKTKDATKTKNAAKTKNVATLKNTAATKASTSTSEKPATRKSARNKSKADADAGAENAIEDEDSPEVQQLSEELLGDENPQLSVNVNANVEGIDGELTDIDEDHDGVQNDTNTNTDEIEKGE